MRKTLLLMALSLFAVTSCAQIGTVSKSASLADNVDGTWKSADEVGMGLSLTLDIDGDTATGYIERGARGSENIINGKVDGNIITFQTFSGFSQDYTCTYADGVITMESSVMDGTVKLTRIEP